MNTAGKVAIGVGGAVVVGGIGYYFFGRIPDMPGYVKLGLAKSQWGRSAVQVRNYQQYLTPDATTTSKAKLSDLVGTIYVQLGKARTATRQPFSFNGNDQYAVAQLARSSTSQNWRLVKVYLSGQSNTAGTITGGSTPS